jgi:hypothetical protein
MPRRNHCHEACLLHSYSQWFCDVLFGVCYIVEISKARFCDNRERTLAGHTIHYGYSRTVIIVMSTSVLIVWQVLPLWLVVLGLDFVGDLLQASTSH